MLSSTKEYLHALRDGKYLLFLEWPQFIAQHYQETENSQDADETISLLVFDWLNNDFSEADAKKIALLCSVYDLASKPIRGNIAYALTAISIAVFQCMLYRSLKIEDKFLTKENLNISQAMTLMSDVMKQINKSTFEDLLIKQQIIFYTWVSDVPSLETDKAYLQISPLTSLRYEAEEYSLGLEAYQSFTDTLKTTRLSVVKRLVRYLHEQTELTEEVKMELSAYVAKIKEMQPADFETGYLATLSPPSLMESTWKIISTIGLGFFNMLQPIQAPSVITKQHDITNNL